MTTLGPVVLEGAHIRLEPLRTHHCEGLMEAGKSPEIWTWLLEYPQTLEAMREMVQRAMQAEEAGREFPFTVVERHTGRVLGTTRYLEVQESHRTAEIGWTWYARDVWATAVNPEAKFLLLQHAFETWGAMRMQLKADSLNARSRAAIAKLGARFEGILRNQRRRRDGTWRDAAMYSMINTEWPAVKERLLARLDQQPAHLSRGQA
jgi:N-acetyltransferase